jgi:TrmH family RNA methyltransferase
LKLVRRLRERRARAREGLFVSEGEDLLEAGLGSGAEPRLLLSAAGSGIGGLEVEPGLLERVSALGSGTRVIAVWEQRWAESLEGPVCIYLHSIGDPANVGAVIRSARALVESTVLLGPGCADPYSTRAVRASMGSVFGQPLFRGTVEQAPAPRIALLAHGGEPIGGSLPPPLTICLGGEREGLPASVVARCERKLTIPLRPGVDSLNVAAAAAIALQRIASAAGDADG